MGTIAINSQNFKSTSTFVYDCIIIKKMKNKKQSS